MSLLQIEGDTSGIRDVQMNYIREVLESRGFKNNKVIFEPVGQAGDNYVANVKRIHVVVEGGENFKIVAKIAPENELMRAAMNAAVMFNNEAAMYEAILPKLVSLQKKADMPEEYTLRHAECYGCFTEAPNEVILLQDLKELDYVMLDRFTSLTDDSIRLILKNFAILHSLSYALKKLEPDTYDRLKSKLTDVWSLTTSADEFKNYMTQIGDSALSIVDEKYKKSLTGVTSMMPELTAKMSVSDKNSKYLTIQQGDAWTNNFLFKLHDDVPKQCIMLDYQISREANPVCDLLYMIFNCSDHALREKHYWNWIDYYHDQLDTCLSEFGMKANYVYPRDQLDADLKRYSKLYLGVSIMLASMLIRNTEEAKAIQEAMKEFSLESMENLASVDTMSSNTFLLFKTRVEGLVESYSLFGYV